MLCGDGQVAVLCLRMGVILESGVFDAVQRFCCIFAALRRGAGVVELARLESVYTRKGIKGSNPFPSATFSEKFNTGVGFSLPTPLRVAKM